MAGIIQRIAEATGKSVDEVAEFFAKRGKTVVSGADELDIGDITSPTMKKGRPANAIEVNPNEIDLGKTPRGKLGIGDVESSPVSVNELDVGDIDQINPNIDDLRLPTANPITERGLQGGGLPPATIADEMSSGPLAQRMSTMPDEVGPEVIGKGTSRASKQSSEAIEAELVKRGMNPKLAKIAAMTGLGIGGGAGLISMMGGDDEVAAKGEATKQSPAPKVETPEQAKKAMKKEAKAQVDTVKGVLGDITEKAQAAGPVDDELPYLDELKAAQAAQGGYDIASLLAQAGADISAGFGAASGLREKPDYSMSDFFKAQGVRKVSDVKAKAEMDQLQDKLKQAKKELSDENAMRDPNSEVSKLVSETAVKAGLLKPGTIVSAQTLKNSGINLGNLLNTIEAGKARKEAAALQREAMKAQKAEQNKLKVQGSIDRQVSQLLKSKDYESYNTAKDAVHALDAALASGDKTSAGSAFMQFAKIAQGDNSVVRDGDMSVLAGSYNYASPSEMFTKLAARAKGGRFNDTELAQMKKVAERVQQIKGLRVQHLVSPIVNRAGSADIDLTESLDPATVEEFAPFAEGITTEPKLPKTGMVKIIPPNGGKAKLIPAEQAQAAIDAGGKLVK